MPEKGINDLYAFIEIANKKKILVVKKIKTGKERVDAQIDYTTQVIKEFQKLLKNKKPSK